MNHVGDITKLDGAKLEPVWCITGGSPCQDLSVAGKGAGLGGERSGLFHEQIRIIKEMIQHDRDLQRPDELIRPRFSIWENVPGAFSSNGGEDFRTVLEEFARIAEPDAVIPRPPKGKWHHAGAILGDGWSLAWRLFDAQYWGVPQRRKRIALVADFGGLSAPEILFERKGLSGDFEQSGAQREEIAGAVGGSAEGASGTISFQERGGKPGGGKGILIQHEHVGALSKLNNQSVLAYGLKAKANCNFRADSETYPVQNSVVRRLTPLECERLQGYPDGWTDIDGASDSARYKALGNSIALPQWQWIIDRMTKYLPEGATLGSLFDGIGGFPLCWERTHGKGTARWASEIENFPIKVTRIRFPEK
jgi:DNA (cytosine-5)-methyltransferase 1